VQPRRKRRFSPKVFQSPVGADERVLGDLLGVGMIPEMTERDGEHLFAVARDDLGKRVLVP
jgi:hypothetical protein